LCFTSDLSDFVSNYDYIKTRIWKNFNDLWHAPRHASFAVQRAEGLPNIARHWNAYFYSCIARALSAELI